MKKLLTDLRLLCVVTVALACTFPGVVRADTNDLPHFQEVLRVLRANLAGVSEEELNRAAVAGLLNQFYPQVMLVTNTATGVEGSARISRTAVYDKAFGYIRVVEVGKGLSDQIASAYAALAQTNKLKGLVLDLRFAGGADYEAAAKAADRFLTGDQLLLDWHDGSARSTAKPDSIKLPVAVLVNRQTAAAAEALAAVLRETDAALLIGATTAGGASVFKEFSLTDGQKLRIASGSVQTGSGRKLTREGLTPDIEVVIAGEDEALFFGDPFAQIPDSASTLRNAGATTNSTARPRRRINEAELVRLQREGQELRDPAQTREELAAPAARSVEAGAEPAMRDLALARALDLLKGIAIMGQVRQP